MTGWISVVHCAGECSCIQTVKLGHSLVLSLTLIVIHTLAGDNLGISLMQTSRPSCL